MNEQGHPREPPAQTTLHARSPDLTPPTLQVKASTVARTLLVAVGLVAGSSLLLQFAREVGGLPIPVGLIGRLDMDREGNIPTWLATISLAGCSLLLFMIARVASDRKDPYAAHWFGLCIVFLYLSVDEAAVLHEASWQVFQQLLQTSGALYPAWVIPAAVAVAVFAFAYLRFLLALPSKIKWLFVLAAVLYVGSAIGLEMLSWHHLYPLVQEHQGDWDAAKGMTYKLIAHAEEVGEMLGVILFMYALLTYLATYVGTVALKFGDK